MKKVCFWLQAKLKVGSMNSVSFSLIRLRGNVILRIEKSCVDKLDIPLVFTMSRENLFTNQFRQTEASSATHTCRYIRGGGGTAK